MRRFGDLPESDKQRAIALARSAILADIVKGSILFEKAIQERIDAALAKADRHTLRSAVYEAVKQEIDRMARTKAENTVYLDAGERAIRFDDEE